jgi:hypothetical protein
MRVLALVAAVTAVITVMGSASATPTKRGGLSCEEQYQHRAFELQLAPPRYVQTTEMDLTSPSDELMRAFQEPGEEQLSVSESGLHLTINPGSCTLDPQSRAHFLECPAASDDKVGMNMSTVSFTANGTSRLGASQSTTIHRSLRIQSVAVHADVQTKKGLGKPEDRVIADITVIAAVGAQARTLHLTKDLGEWTGNSSLATRSENDRCLVTYR